MAFIAVTVCALITRIRPCAQFVSAKLGLRRQQNQNRLENDVGEDEDEVEQSQEEMHVE
jgi:hypothetical protein